MASYTSRIDLAVTLRPRVPKGDESDAASAVLNTVVARMLALSDEMRAIANEYVDAAPASGEHVLDLNATISRAVLEWVERWPTVIDAMLLLLATWLFTWVLLMLLYLGLQASVENVTAQWHRYQRTRRYRQAAAAELARIDRNASASVQRISAAFMLAQRLIRDQADAESRPRAS